MIILDFIVLIFSDIIFLTLFGWAVNPIYNAIERAYNTAIADSFLLIIELIFYGLVLAGIILLIEKICRDRRKLKGSKKAEKAAIRAQKDRKKSAKEARKTISKKDTKGSGKSNTPQKKKREYREYV